MHCSIHFSSIQGHAVWRIPEAGFKLASKQCPDFERTGIVCAAMQFQKQPKATTRLMCSSARRIVRAAAASLHKERLCCPSTAVPLNPSLLLDQVHLFPLSNF